MAGMPKPVRLAWWATPLLLIVTPLAVAQDVATETPAENPAVNQGSAVLDPVMVTTATRTQREQSQLSAGVEVISQQEIADSGQSTLDGVLRELSSVYVSPTGNSFSIRGASREDTLILINGRRIGGESSRRYELNRLTTGQIEQVEIVKGPAGVQYGSDAIGGVINIITRAPQAGFGGSVELDLGSAAAQARRTGDFSLDLFGGNETTQLSAYLGVVDKKPYRNFVTSPVRIPHQGEQIPPSEHPNGRVQQIPDQYHFEEDLADEARIYNVGTRLRQQPSPSVQLGLHLDYMEESRSKVYSGDRQRTGITTGSGNDIYAFGLPLEWTDDNNRLDYGAELEWAVSDDLGFDYQVYRSRYDKERSVLVVNYEDVGFDNQEQSNDGRQGGSPSTQTTHELSSHWRIAEHSHVLAGAEYRSDHNRDNRALFVQHEWNPIESLTLIYGARRDSASVGNARTSYQAGLVHELSPALRWRVNFSQGFKVPENRDYNVEQINPGGHLMLGAHVVDPMVGKVSHELQPETSENIELGIAGRLVDFDYDLTVFQNVIDNRVERVFENPTGEARYLTFRNISQARIRGVETQLNRQITRDISINLSATWLDAQNRQTSKQLTDAPRFAAQLRGTWQATANLRLRAGIRHQGQRYLDGDNTEKSAAYTLANIGASYTPASCSDVDVYAGIENLFDQDNDSSLRADPGRRFFAGARWYW